MHRRIAFATVAGTAVLALAFAAGRLSIAKGDEKEKAEGFQPPKPGKDHEALKLLEGTWEGKGTFRMAADAPPMESTSVDSVRLGGGGFWLITDSKGKTSMGPFEGHGVQGYDSSKKKYVGVWVDSMADYMFPYEGTYDTAAKTWTSMGTAKDMEGKPLKVIMKTVIKDADHYTFTMRHPDPSGKEMEAVKIEYTRKK
jgi:hypothetical protein